MNPVIDKELREQLDQMPPERQRQVLDFARALAGESGRGVTGRALSQFGGAIAKDDLRIIAQAIEEGCEQVNPDEW